MPEISPARRAKFLQEKSDEVLDELGGALNRATEFILDSMENHEDCVTKASVWSNVGRRKALRDFLSWMDSEIHKEDGPKANE